MTPHLYTLAEADLTAEVYSMAGVPMSLMEDGR